MLLWLVFAEQRMRAISVYIKHIRYKATSRRAWNKHQKTRGSCGIIQGEMNDKSAGTSYDVDMKVMADLQRVLILGPVSIWEGAKGCLGKSTHMERCFFLLVTDREF